ncbi:MAG: NAD(P)-dependent oxidoreductase [Muribaculaceae bacterium]|nr:NAD(P)-dependent oxidoreductase [Muribaculaceae bacterium]
MTGNAKRRVLIVGAGGFLGSHLLERAVGIPGLEVYAGVRASTSDRYFPKEGVTRVDFDFEDPADVERTLTTTLPEGEKCDLIVYNLGATKCLRYKDFDHINHDLLRTFVETLERTGTMPEKFLYISSLSAMGPGDPRSYTPFSETMVPQPNTRYGASKLKAEMLLQMHPVPYIIFRCTGIYGPRDHDYFMMFDAMRKGFDFSVGFRRQLLTFIYAPDLAEAVFTALEKAPAKEVYNIAEPRAYSQAEFRRIAASKLGRKIVIPVKVPLWGTKVVSWVAEKIGVVRGKPSTLNTDKYNIMKQRNWSADTRKAREAFGFTASTPLAKGVEQSIEWYRKEGWMK